MMLDHVFVERIGSKFAFRRSKLQLLARHEPKQVAFFAAMRAVAFHGLFKIAFDFKCDTTAMAHTFVNHLILLLVNPNINADNQMPATMPNIF